MKKDGEKTNILALAMYFWVLMLTIAMLIAVATDYHPELGSDSYMLQMHIHETLSFFTALFVLAFYRRRL